MLQNKAKMWYFHIYMAACRTSSSDYIHICSMKRWEKEVDLLRFSENVCACVQIYSHQKKFHMITNREREIVES